MEGVFATTSIAADDQQSIYQRKYYALKRKCEEVQQTKEKLVNRIHHVKKIIRKYKKHRRFLISRLDGYNDNYMDVLQPAVFEDYSLITGVATSTSGDALPSNNHALVESKPNVVKCQTKRSSVLDSSTSTGQLFSRAQDFIS